MADSGLIAVCLIIRSREGPRFVFHYPPHPSPQSSQITTLYGTDLLEDIHTTSSEDSSPNNSDLEDDSVPTHTFNRLSLTSHSSKKRAALHHLPTVEDEHYETKKGKHVVPWERVFDYSTQDLESILTPNRAFHKRRFELELDPLWFLSYPMHIREDGHWKKKRVKRSKRKQKLEDSVGELAKSDVTTPEVDDAVDGGTGKERVADNTSEDGEDHGGMTMFNVVFVLSLSKQEAKEKTLEIYEHVIKKFNKALRHAQAEDNFVWKESERILSLKEKAREERRLMSSLWTEILGRSTLAASIRDVFTSISNNKIATVQLATTSPLEVSLQIPIPPFLTSLPTSSERAMPGLPVTSANPFASSDEDTPEQLNKHFALLLLDDEDKIVAEIQKDNTELSAPLLECIRLCKPTQSFLQVAQANSTKLDSILILSQHLIYWRKAIAVPPLHSRETYIVSPNCDSRRLPEADKAWKKAFPLSPSLPSFLATISAAPRPYKTFAPSKNHRPTYLDMLAWLIRGGWVTQLRTFAWIIVWPEILYEVEYQLKASALEKISAKKKKQQQQETSSYPHAPKVRPAPQNDSPGSTDEFSASPTQHRLLDPNIPLTSEQKAENARLSRLSQKASEAFASEALSFSQLPKPVSTRHPSSNNAEHLDHLSPYIIRDPHKVSHEESLYIAAIGKRFENGRESWAKFVKYFNGEDALEMVPLVEGVRRKEIWGILGGFQEYLLICKHW